jgi:hypothetical protein
MWKVRSFREERLKVKKAQKGHGKILVIGETSEERNARLERELEKVGASLKVTEGQRRTLEDAVRAAKAKRRAEG